MLVGTPINSIGQAIAFMQTSWSIRAPQTCTCRQERVILQVSDSKKREMGGSNVFAGNQDMDVAPRASIAVKQPPGGGSNISFGSSEPLSEAPHQSRRKPPGGSSSFIFG